MGLFCKRPTLYIFARQSCKIGAFEARNFNARGVTQAWRYRKLSALSFPLAQSAAAAPVASASRE
jgi:hypothetical protein